MARAKRLSARYRAWGRELLKRSCKTAKHKFRNKTVLQAGMILSNEPGFYIPGKYGIRIENLMYVKENNGWLEFESLSLVPYASKLIDVKLLNIDEINYIKEYYNKIRAKIYDLLSTQVRNWLNNEINLFLQSLL